MQQNTPKQRRQILKRKPKCQYLNNLSWVSFKLLSHMSNIGIAFGVCVVPKKNSTTSDMGRNAAEDLLKVNFECEVC